MFLLKNLEFMKLKANKGPEVTHRHHQFIVTPNHHCVSSIASIQLFVFMCKHIFFIWTTFRSVYLNLNLGKYIHSLFVSLYIRKQMYIFGFVTKLFGWVLSKHIHNSIQTLISIRKSSHASVLLCNEFSNKRTYHDYINTLVLDYPIKKFICFSI